MSRSGGPGLVSWNPSAGRLDPDDVGGFDAVIHLAGESINGRWTDEKKKAVRDSRVEGTKLLVDALRRSGSPPKVFASASAIGIYGSCEDQILTETSVPGQGFLAEVGEAWERASDEIGQMGVRRVLVRIGIVLDPDGGALGEMLTPFRLGLGGPIGSGKQWMSWITKDDVCQIFERAITDESWKGPINAVAGSVTNKEFVRTLGRVLKRPAIAPLPAFAVKLLFGEMGEALLLGSTRVEPAALRKAGYPFLDPDLERAMRRMLAT